MSTVQFLPNENPTRENFNAKFSQLENLIGTGSGSGGTTESIEYPGCFYRMVNDVQEWLNPPMEMNVEYRTTERYLGKPVYVQMFDYGAVPTTITSTSKTIVAENCDQVLMYNMNYHAPTGYGENNGRPLVTSGTIAAYDWITNNSDGSLILSIRAVKESLSYNARAFVKYTKTTD